MRCRRNQAYSVEGTNSVKTSKQAIKIRGFRFLIETYTKPSNKSSRANAIIFPTINLSLLTEAYLET